MKQFIVLAAILPIMLVFVAQFSLEAVRSLRMNAAEDAVRAFCIEAAYHGGGRPEDAEALRYRLAQIFRADAADVFVELAQNDEWHIGWRVSFPVGGIMAGARLMGLTEAENRGRAQMEGVIAIAPPPPEPQTDEIGPPGEPPTEPQTPETTSLDETQPDETPPDNPPSDKTQPGKPHSDETPAGEMPSNETPLP